MQTLLIRYIYRIPTFILQAVVLLQFPLADYQNSLVSTNILTARTRVAPSIATSIFRQVMLQAVIGFQSLTRLSTVLIIAISISNLWTASVNLLGWIRAQSSVIKL